MEDGWTLTDRYAILTECLAINFLPVQLSVPLPLLIILPLGFLSFEETMM